MIKPKLTWMVLALAVIYAALDTLGRKIKR